MTENEKVKKWFKLELSMREEESLDAIECEDMMDICVKALEEIQQYKAIGTVEQLKTLQEDYWKLNEISKEYSAIGTIEEFKALKEKSVAKKPLRIPDDDTCVYYGYYCPCCNEPLSNTARMKRCFCGQLLDWSE